MDVGVLSVAALLAFAAAALGAFMARRRAARRAAEARARQQVRRRRVPQVSANLRGLQRPEVDLWSRESDDRPRDGRAA